METIGIIDDDEDSGQLLSFMLKDKWHLNVFQDWELALKAFEASPPNLILLDISMPGMKGEEILKLIRSSRQLKDIGVIAITGYALPDDRIRFLKMGFNAYIAKPIKDQSSLCSLIKNVLMEHIKRF